MEILNVKNLSFRYPVSAEKALCDINLRVYEGDFIVLCGSSGSGKTTLLRLLKSEIAPHGEIEGEIYCCGKKQSDMSSEESAFFSGYVTQNPETQIVTDKVRHELVFAMENLAFPRDLILRRTAELASLFGITEWINKNTSELSGGQKQLLNLASVMAASPRLLLLDEPSSYLDPVSAERFFNAVKKLNRENGITVIISEHRTEHLLGDATSLALLENGRLIGFGRPQDIVAQYRDNVISAAFPAAVRIWQGLGREGECPLSVVQCRNRLSGIKGKVERKPDEQSKKEISLSVKNVCFRYGKKEKDILKNLSLTLYKGEIFCLLGGNAGGKTTAVKVMSGILKPYDGYVKLYGKKLSEYGSGLYRHGITALPQNAVQAFLRDTVYEDLTEICRSCGYEKSETENKIHSLAKKMKVEHLFNKNPLDLSGGELQKCALTKALLTEPKVLLLDEPEKGIDAAAKKELTALLRSVAEDGMTVFAVTHDLEFASETAHRCAMLFDGEILKPENVSDFFLKGELYTTDTVRITHGIIENAVTVSDVLNIVGSGSIADTVNTGSKVNTVKTADISGTVDDLNCYSSVNNIKMAADTAEKAGRFNTVGTGERTEEVGFDGRRQELKDE